MNNRFIIIYFLFFFFNNLMFSQEENSKNEIDILRPSKAAFYSAVIPGLGQIYNKKAWKVPIVYAAGFTDDQYQGIIINDDRLLDGQDFHKKYKDLSMVFLVGFYFLNILDANIDAHLLDFNVNENLSFEPYFENDIVFEQSIGLKVKMNL